MIQSAFTSLDALCLTTPLPQITNGVKESFSIYMFIIVLANHISILLFLWIFKHVHCGCTFWAKSKIWQRMHVFDCLPAIGSRGSVINCESLLSKIDSYWFGKIPFKDPKQFNLIETISPDRKCSERAFWPCYFLLLLVSMHQHQSSSVTSSLK